MLEIRMPQALLDVKFNKMNNNIGYWENSSFLTINKRC